MPTQLTDHAHRQRSCEVPHQVHQAVLGAARKVVEQILDNRLDPRPEPAGEARGEGG